MQMLKTQFVSSMLPKLTGAKKLLIVSVLSVVGGLIALMSEGSTFVMALLHSTTLAALQVFANQIFQQVVNKKKVTEKKA